MPKTCYDAAYPPATPPQTDAVLIYAGGDAVHVWTAAEIAAQTATYGVPCFVRSNPSSADVQADVAAMAAWLQANDVPTGSAIMLDLETAVDPVYVEAFALGLAGYVVLPYGSLDYVFQNPSCGGYWTAHPGATAIDTEPDVVATQYAYDLGGGAYDLSWIADSVVLWTLKTPAPTPPPTPPAPTPPAPPTPTEVSVNVPELSYNGGTDYQSGEWVRIVQWRVGSAVDGQYGPATKAAVESFQRAHGLSVDGVVGPETANAIANG